MWIVDTNLILDIALNDAVHLSKTQKLLQKYLSQGLAVSPITEIELSPMFGGEIVEVRKFLDLIGIEHSLDWQASHTANASYIWAKQISLRKQVAIQKRVVADMLTLGFAKSYKGLLTRDKGFDKRLVKGVKVVE